MRHAQLWGFAIAAATSFSLTELVKWGGDRLGWLDRDEGRRILDHRRVTRIGGVAMAVAFTVVLAVFKLCLNAPGADELASPLVWLGGGAMFLIGLYDDVRGVAATVKLAALFLAGALVSVAGLGIRELPFIHVALGPVGDLLATSLWFALVGTAWNFIDGLDGLAAGLTLSAALTLWVASPGSGALPVALLGGVSLGFLAHNRHPARLFMGDSGSFFLGFWVALLSISASRAGRTDAAALAVVTALAWPLVDTLFAIVCRLRRRRLFQAGRDHLHYALNARFGHPRTVLLALAIAGSAAVAAVLISRNTAAGLMLAGSLATAWLFCARARITRGVVLAAVLSGSCHSTIVPETIANMRAQVVGETPGVESP